MVNNKRKIRPGLPYPYLLRGTQDTLYGMMVVAQISYLYVVNMPLVIRTVSRYDSTTKEKKGKERQNTNVGIYQVQGIECSLRKKVRFSRKAVRFDCADFKIT